MQKKQAVIIFSTAYLPLIGGAELAIKEITDRIDGLDFFLITSRIKRSFPCCERIGNVSVYRIGFGIPIFDKLLSPFAGALIARRLAKRHDVICFWSIMITFASGAPFLLKLFRLHRNIPILLTLQEGDSPHYIRYGRFGFINLSWRLALQFADHVQVISNYLADMARVYGYKGEISIVPNGANIKNFQFSIFNFQKKGKIIITTSRLVKKNGIDILIDAIARVKERMPDVQCWILGDGEEKEKCELQVTTYNLQANVKFFGTIPYEEVPNYLAQADVFVRSSRSEGLGTAFLDAMAAGLPIIGTAVGGIPDFLKDGETGLFARVDDANDLAEKIERLLKNDALRKRLAENGRRLVEEHYDWNSIADRIRALFSKRRALRLLIATGIYPPDIGGPATYSQIIAEEFSKREVIVNVVTYADIPILNFQPAWRSGRFPISKQIQNFSPSLSELPPSLKLWRTGRRASKFQIHKISRKWPKGLRHILYFLIVLWHGRNADVIYAQQPVGEGLPAMLAAKMLRKKFFLKVVGDYAWEQGVQRFGVADLLDDFLLARTRQAGGQKKYGWFTLGSPARRTGRFSVGGRMELLRTLESFVARCADCIIVPSNYLAGVITRWGVLREHIAVIPNAVEIPHDLSSKEEARRGLGILENEKIILSAGRLVPWKGFAALIESMEEIIKQEPNAKLVIIGSGPYQSKLESRIMNYELGNNIRLIGSLSHENVLQHLRAADVFALNTAYEGFSHLIIEAMTIGAPIVTTLAGGNAEIVRDGENALVVPYNDRGKITQAILRVLRESVLREALVENGRQIAAEFTKKRMIDETLRILT